MLACNVRGKLSAGEGDTVGKVECEESGCGSSWKYWLADKVVSNDTWC